MDLNHPLLNSDEHESFPASQPLLTRLDRIPFCPICKDYYRGPVSIACGHSFCSACIRSFLDVQKKCPSCHEPAKEGSIRRNRVLEEMTDAWEAARPTLLQLAQPQRRAGPSSDRDGERRAKRRRTSGVENGIDSGPSVELASGSSSVVEAEGYSSAEEMLTESGEEKLTPDEAHCPMCSAVLKISAIPGHIDKGCPPPRANQKADWKKVFSGAGSAKDKLVVKKRIVKPNYSLISTSELRGLLTEHGLNTSGDRPALEARFQDWIVLYNANLDTSHPCSLSALRHELDVREAARAADKKNGKEGKVDELKSKDGLARHAKEQKGEFERLRREILARKERKKQQQQGAVDSPIEVE